mgnify:CR=1 FL=1
MSLQTIYHMTQIKRRVTCRISDTTFQPLDLFMDSQELLNQILELQPQPLLYATNLETFLETLQKYAIDALFGQEHQMQCGIHVTYLDKLLLLNATIAHVYLTAHILAPFHIAPVQGYLGLHSVTLKIPVAPQSILSLHNVAMTIIITHLILYLLSYYIQLIQLTTFLSHSLFTRIFVDLCICSINYNISI